MKKRFFVFGVAVVGLLGINGYMAFLHHQIKEEVMPYGQLTDHSFQATLVEKEPLTTDPIENPESIAYETIRFEVPEAMELVPTLSGKVLKLESEAGESMGLMKSIFNFFEMTQSGAFISGGESISSIESLIQELTENEIETEYELLKFLYSEKIDIPFFAMPSTLRGLYLKASLKNSATMWGSEKYLAHFEFEHVKGFQVCAPEIEGCDTTIILFFIGENEATPYLMQFWTGFDQKTIDQIVQSIQNL